MKNNLKIKLREQQIKRQLRGFTHKVAVFVIAFMACKTHAQEDEKVSQINGDNEFKVNGLYFVIGAAEFTYERILSEETALGLSVAFDIDNDNFYNFAAFPYYRFYFGKKRAGGFFIEGNGAVIVDEFGKEATLTVNGNNGSLSINDSGDVTTKFGLGIGVGGKFLSKNGWIGELSMGFGRTFGVEDDYYKTYGRFGITIGKRF